MIFLMRDSMLHPAQSRPFLAVEARDELQHEQLSSLSELFVALRMARDQQTEQRALRSASTHMACVLLDEPGKRLTA